MSDLRNSLADLAEQILEHGKLIAEADKVSVEHALQAGFLLCKAKDECQHGEWLPFLQRAGVGERKAQRWMRLARAGLKSDTLTDLGSVSAALEYIDNLTLPEAGDILFVSRIVSEADNGISAWVEPWPEDAGCFRITAIRPDGEVFRTIKHPSGELVEQADGYMHPVWVCLNEMLLIVAGEQDFTIMPAEMLEQDDFGFLDAVPDPASYEDALLISTTMPASYSHTVERLQACLDDYSLDRAKAAWRALRALNAKMEDWPRGPKMIPIYKRISNDNEISRLEDRVQALVCAHNPELFEEGATA